MIVEERDFQLKSVNPNFWDLRFKVEKRKRTGEIVEELGDAYYGLPIQIAKRAIATNRAKGNTLIDFLKSWKKELIEIESKWKKIKYED